MELAKLASHAVDFPKSGTPVNFTQLPRFRSRNQPKPDFLAKEGADLNSDQYYNSKKLLGQLYRRVPVKRWIPQEWNEDRSPSDGASVEDALSRVGLRNLGLSGLTPPTQELIEEMTYLLEAYCEQLLVIGQSHTILKNKDSHVSEAELLSGTIMANWSDHHRRRDAVTAMNLQVSLVLKHDMCHKFLNDNFRHVNSSVRSGQSSWLKIWRCRKQRCILMKRMTMMIGPSAKNLMIRNNEVWQRRSNALGQRGASRKIPLRKNRGCLELRALV